MEAIGGRSVKVSKKINPTARSVYDPCPADTLEGSVTDYGSTMVQWMRNRQPRYKAASKVEYERPSASYMVDVRTQESHLLSPRGLQLSLIKLARCFHP